MKNKKVDDIINDAVKRGSDRISLSHLNLEEIPDEILSIPLLKRIELQGNKIRDITKLCQIKSLTFINISNNEISDLSPIKKLINLEQLFIDYNQIIDLNQLEGLNKLIRISISSNFNLLSIAPLAKLPKLQYIVANSCIINQIDDYVNYFRITKTTSELIYIDLAGSRLESFPYDFFEYFPEVTQLYVQGTKIKNLPRFATSTVENVAFYLSDFFSQKEGYLQQRDKRIRILLIGNSEAGKTTFRELLNTNSIKKELSSTHGIEHILYTHQSLDIEADIWDFGGQSFYHNTHSLFFSDGAIYILFWENATNTNSTLKKEETEYDNYHYLHWLNNITFLLKNKIEIKDSYSSRILLVQNKGDLAGRRLPISKEVFDKFDLDPGNSFFISLTMLDKEIQDKMLSARWENEYSYFITKLFLEATDIIKKRKGSISFFNEKMIIREFIESKQFESIKDNFFITIDEFKLIIDEKLEKNISENEFLNILDYLHRTGIILYFANEAWGLDKYVFPDIIKVSDLIYDVLSKEVRSVGGIFTESKLKSQLDNKWKQNTSEIINILKKFQLIIEIYNNENQEDKKYVALQYIKDTYEYSINDNYTNLKDMVYFKFPEYIPSNVISQQIIKYANTKRILKYWKNGLEFLSSKSNMLHHIYVFKESESDIKDNYFVRVRHHKVDNDYSEFSSFLRDFSILNENFLEISFDNIKYFKVNNLNPEVIKKKSLVSTDNSPISLTDWQEQELFTFLDEKPEQTLNIFISYSSKDESITKIFEKNLDTTLINHARYKIWSDNYLLSGDKFEKKIFENLGQAHVVIILASSFALKSEWVEKELNFAKSNSVRIIPIFVNKEAMNTPNYKLIKEIHTSSKINGKIRGLEDNDGWESNNREERCDLLCNILFNDLKTLFPSFFNQE